MTPYLKDLLERVVASFVGGFLSAASLEGLDVVHTDWKAWLAVGAAAGVAAVVKGLVARRIGDTGTPSLVPSLITIDRVAPATRLDRE
jgi:hypothetical protein